MCLFVVHKMFKDKTSGSSEMGDTPAGTANVFDGMRIAIPRAEDPLGSFFSSELAEAVPAEREPISLEERA